MRSEKLKIIKNVLGRGYQSGHEYLFGCPFCKHHKMKMSVNVDKSAFKCWICDKSGRDLGYIVRKFGTRQDRDEWAKYDDQVEITDFDFLFKAPDEPCEQRIDLPEALVSLTAKTPPATSWAAQRYLTKRGITKDDIFKWKIGYCAEGEYAGRIVEDIVIVEGVFDAIKAGNAIPLLGSTLRESSALFQAIVKNGNRVFLALDEDASKKTRSISRLLLKYGIETYEVDTSGIEDVGDMSKEEFQVRKSKASFIEKDNYLLQRLSAI